MVQYRIQKFLPLRNRKDNTNINFKMSKAGYREKIETNKRKDTTAFLCSSASSESGTLRHSRHWRPRRLHEQKKTMGQQSHLKNMIDLITNLVPIPRSNNVTSRINKIQWNVGAVRKTFWRPPLSFVYGLQRVKQRRRQCETALK